MATAESFNNADRAWTEGLAKPPTPENVAAHEAFHRDLPELLQTHRGEFVAYHGGIRLGINESPFVLEDLCGNYPIGTCLVVPIDELDDIVVAEPNV